MMTVIIFLLLIIILVLIWRNSDCLQQMQINLQHYRTEIQKILGSIQLQPNAVTEKDTPYIPTKDEEDRKSDIELSLDKEKIPETIPEYEVEEAIVPGVQEAIEESVSAETPFAKPTEPTPGKKTRFEATAKDILRKFWSWILVGEEYGPKNVSIEYAVASTWLMRLGIIALVICIGYFLMWTIERGLLGPNGRIAISVFAGIAMLIIGIKNLKNKYHILAQGFLGGGLAALYFSMYAAGPMYHRIPLTAAFVLMTLITVVAGILSFKANSQLIAIFGIIGGFCTPLMLQIPTIELEVLYGYMLLLSVGILGIAHVRNWRLLNYLGFIFTWLIFFLCLPGYMPKSDFTITIVFLTLLFILHSVIVYYYNVINRKHSTSLEIAHLLLNVLFYAANSYALIIQAYGRPWPAVMAIGVAAFYILHVFGFLKFRINDRNLLIALVGIAGFFTVWAVPLLTEKETLTICWALQAFFFLWIGLKLNSNLLITLSHIMYLLIMGRIVFLDMPRNFGDCDWYDKPMIEYWQVFLERMWTFGIVFATFFGGFVLYRTKIRQISAFAVEEDANTTLPVPQSTSREIIFWCGVGLLFIVLYLEFFQMFTYYLPLQMPILTLLCCGLGVFLLYRYTTTGRSIFLNIVAVVLVIVLIKLFTYDLCTWITVPQWYIYKIETIGVLMRFLDYGIIFLFIMAILRVICKRNELITYRRTFTAMSTALLFVYTSLETNTFFYWYVPAFQEGSLSVLWALFANAFLIIGIVKSSTSWRYAGLVLFVVVVGKVFFIDLADMVVVYRIIAFMVLGILFIGGSFAYLKANKKFEIKEDVK